MKQWMTIRTSSIFLASFLLFLLAFHGLSYYLHHQQEHSEKRQGRIILENVKDRFNLFINVPIVVGHLGAELFAGSSLTTRGYGPFNSKMLHLKKGIIGLNLIDANGVIVKVFPKEMNIKAEGNITQNFEFLKKSFNLGQPYWFSPPFKLFQGMQGFVLYFPIVKDQKLQGWFCTVISTEAFVKQFDLEQFLNVYDMVIKDKKSNQPFYSTGLEPSDDRLVHETGSEIDGRELVFKIWKKNPIKASFLPWSWMIIASIFFAVILVLLDRINEQKKRVRTQLEDVSTLLKLTSKEALSKLVDLQNEIYKLGSTDTISYITHLIEQIDLLQTTAYTGKEIETEIVDVLPLIMNELDDLKELSEKKNLFINIGPENFTNIKVHVNAWLFKNTVLSKILTHLIVQSGAGSGLSIDYQKSHGRHTIVFHAQRLHQADIQDNVINMDRRMSVAKKVLSMFHGDLHLDHDLGGGLIIRITLPIPELNS